MIIVSQPEEMPDEATISMLTDSAMFRSERTIGILTPVSLQEASVLVFVFGILDTYAGNRLTATVGEIVSALGLLSYSLLSRSNQCSIA